MIHRRPKPCPGSTCVLTPPVEILDPAFLLRTLALILTLSTENKLSVWTKSFWQLLEVAQLTQYRYVVASEGGLRDVEELLTISAMLRAIYALEYVPLLRDS